MSLSFAGVVVGANALDPNFSIRIRPNEAGERLPHFVDFVFSELPGDLTLGSQVTITVAAPAKVPPQSG